ncbi:hypothetical protein WJX82_003406 [Trebouxia sp. C0006]
MLLTCTCISHFRIRELRFKADSVQRPDRQRGNCTETLKSRQRFDRNKTRRIRVTGTGFQSPAVGQRRPGLHSVNHSDFSAVAESQEGLVTFVQLQAIAENRGMHLRLQTLGPVYRIVCRDGDAAGPILAKTNGFVLPLLKLMHCDTMQVFTPRLAEADRERIRGGSFFGLSLLIVAAIMSHGHECGCVKAEMLAINDDDQQHARLVKYYRRMGFEKILEVGNNGLSDLPHLLVWGGAGTRMNCNPEQFLRRWAPLLKKSSKGSH